MSKHDQGPPDDRRDAAFRTTHWSQIFTAQSRDEPERKAALEEILGRYWKPVYYYLRSKGHADEQAKDLTQGFFVEVVLRRTLVQRADRARGRFRTFLLRSLDRYLVSVNRAKKAKQRMPEAGFVSLEGFDGIQAQGQTHCTTPAEAFDYAWAIALLDGVISDVECDCRKTDKGTHWEIFHARILQPIMDGCDPPSLASVCSTYNLPNNAKAFNMIMTVKRRFQSTLRRHVRQFVESEEDVDCEIRDLMSVFRKGRARK